MTAAFDLFPQGESLALSLADANPVVDTDLGFGDAFSAGLDAHNQYRASDSEANGQHQYVQTVIDKLHGATGESYVNPLDFFWTNSSDHDAAYAKLRNRLSQMQKERPDLGLPLLTNEEIAAGGLQVSRQTALAQPGLAARRTSWKSSLGNLAGDIVGSLEDPVNAAITLATLPLTGGRSILGAAAQQGAIGGGSEMLVQALNADYRSKVDPDYSLATAAGEVAEATLGAAGLGAGFRALGKAWEAFRGTAPRQTADSAAAVQRAAVVERTPVPMPTAQAQVAHQAAVAEVEKQIQLGLPVDVPPEAKAAVAARAGRVFDSDGRQIGVQYEVVEANSLITSHTADFRPDPRFPPELQPRARERAMSQEQVAEISGQLQPERLGPSPQADSGAPVVGPDGVVESGNGRVMAIRKAYDGPNGAGYRKYLEDQGYNTEGMSEPVLIARRTSDLTPEERVGFVNAANRATAMRLSAPEQALADARLVDEQMLSMIRPGHGVFDADFVRSFMGKLPVSERGALADSYGVLSAEGVRRIQGAMMGRAYGEPALLSRALEDADSNIKALAGALSDAAGAWAKMRDNVSRATIPQGMDITRDLLDAMRLVIKSRDEKVPFNDLINQAEMFDGPSEIGKALGKFMYKGNRPVARGKVADMLKEYAAEAEKNTAGARLFGEPLGQQEILGSVLEKAGRADVLPEMQARLQPDLLDKALADPKTDDAVLLEGERAVAATLTGEIEKIMVPVAADDGTLKMRPLTEVMDEFDQQIEAADRIDACLSGKAETPK